jgi:methyl-accepting chemotaxis protein
MSENIENIAEALGKLTNLQDRLAEQTEIVAAVDRSMAVIEFTMEGVITKANTNFCTLIGYTEEELVGQHHRILMPPGEADTEEYRQLWVDLGEGQPREGRFRRIRKDGSNAWLQACYNPIHGVEGDKVVKLAYGVTAQVERAEQLQEALEEAEEAKRIRQELDYTLQQMSTPITPIWEKVLLLPLVGIVDSHRTDDVMRKVLGEISRTKARQFILDISGVPTVDTAVANQLMKVSRATRIMGCETRISGVSAAIAHTIVELGVDVNTMHTTATLEDALADCLDILAKEKEAKKKRGKKPGKAKD